MKKRSALVVSAAVLSITLLSGLTAEALPAARIDASFELNAPTTSGRLARTQVAALPRATAVNDTDGNNLFDDLDVAFATAADSAELPVIVSFHYGISTNEGMAEIRAAGVEPLVAASFNIVPGFTGKLSMAEAHAVAQLDVVRQLEIDSPGVSETDSSTEVMGADAVVDGLGITGSLDGRPRRITDKDVGIAVIDTGIAEGHPDLTDGKIRALVDFVSGEEDSIDNDGHGTHVASIAAGWGRGDAKYRGVAPGAAIINVRLLNKLADPHPASKAIQAYEWIVQNRRRYNIRVATMSIGFGGTTDGTSALERAVDATWDAGIVCFKSAGNEGPWRSSVTGPGSARGIIAMGSVLDPAGRNDLDEASYGFKLSQYSSRGPTLDGRVKPDLVAPGEWITGAALSGGYTIYNGTSQASPFGAGTAALMIAAKPSLGPDKVRSILFRTAEDWGAEGPDNEYGHGRIQVLEAVRAVLGVSSTSRDFATRPKVPAHDIFTGTADPDGSTEGLFSVRRTEFPVAVTAIATSGETMFDVLVRDPDGRLVGGTAGATLDPATRFNDSTWHRQASFSFMPEQPGDYTFEVLTEPSTRVTVDVSHSSTRQPSPQRHLI